MNQIMFTPLQDQNLLDSVQELTNSSSSIKRLIFKRVLSNSSGFAPGPLKDILGSSSTAYRYQSDLDKVCKQFMTSVDTFLKMWSEYTDLVKSAMRQIRDTSGIKSVITFEYKFIKNYVYKQCDYASVLRFTDGLLKGISSGSIRKPEDVVDFKESNIHHAFGNVSPSIQGLMHDTLMSDIGDLMKPVGLLDIELFNNIRMMPELFNLRTRPELYKSIDATIKYLKGMNVANIISNMSSHKDMRVVISFINNVIEYIIYSLAAYACRTYVIAHYTYPFVMEYNNINNTPVVSPTDAMAEAVENCMHTPIDSLDGSENPNGSISAVFHTTEEDIIKNHRKFNKFMEHFEAFLKDIGCSKFDKDDEDSSKTEKTPSSVGRGKDRFSNKLENNILYAGIIGNNYKTKPTAGPDSLELIKHELEIALYNQYQGLSEHTTPKQEMLHHIRGCTCEENAGAYKQLAKDLFVFTRKVGSKLCSTIDKYIRDYTNMRNNHKPIYITDEKNFHWCLTALLQLYEEIMFAVAQKATYIERRINELRKSEVKKVIDNTTINIDGIMSDTSLDHYVMLSVPDTTRMPMELFDKYEIPSLTEALMYNEYLASLPEFANDAYFAEAIGDNIKSDSAANLFAKIMGIIQAISDAMMSFYGGEKFKAVHKWIVDNEQAIRKIDFTGIKIEAFDYDPRNGYRGGDIVLNISDEIKAMNVTEAKKDPMKHTEELYKKILGEEIAKIWIDNPNDENVNKTRAIRYKNWLLFKKDDTKPIQPVPLEGEDLKNRVFGNPGWLGELKLANQEIDIFNKCNNIIKSALEEFRKKVINDTSTTNNTAPATPNKENESGDKPEQTGANTTQTNTTQDSTTQNNTNTADTTSIIIRVMRLINNLYRPIFRYDIEQAVNMYNAIKEIYNQSQSKNTQTQSEESGSAI